MNTSVRQMVACAAGVTLSVLGASCNDFSLEQRTRRPEVVAIAPESAFAGEWVELSGSNFDARPEGNLVLFNGGSARAGEFTDQGALRVRVPEDVRDGPLAVVTPEGQSAPFGSFTYRGLGHPRRGAISGMYPVMLRAAGVAVVNREVFIASELLRSVVDAQGWRIDLPEAPSFFAASPDGDRLLAAGTASGVLWLIDPARRRESDAAAIVAKFDLGPVGEVLLLRTARTPTGRPLARVFALGSGGTLQLVEVDPVAGRVSQPFDLGLAYVDDAESTADGAWMVITGGWNVEGGVEHGVLVVDTSRQPYTVRRVALPESALQRGPLTIAGQRALLPLVDGTLATLEFTAAAPAFLAERIETFRGKVITELTALAGPDGEPLLLAAIPAEGRVVATSLAGHRLWSVEVGAEILNSFAHDPATKRLYAVDKRANAVEVIDYAAGVSVDRVTFSLGLGSTSDAPAQGIAFDPNRARMLVPAGRMRMVVSIHPQSLEFSASIRLDQAASAPRAVAVAPDRRVWVLHEHDLGYIEGEREVLVMKDFPGLGQRLAFAADGSVLAGLNDRVVVIRGNEVVGGFAFPGGFLELLEPKGDQVLVVWSQSAGQLDVPYAALWKIDDLAAGREPLLRLEQSLNEDPFMGAIALGGEALLFFSPQRAEPADYVVALGSGLEVGEQLPSSVQSIGPVLATPDGRRLLWTDVLSDDGQLHLAERRADRSVADTSVDVLPGPLCGIAFEPRGERGFVPVCGSDTIAILE